MAVVIVVVVVRLAFRAAAYDASRAAGNVGLCDHLHVDGYAAVATSYSPAACSSTCRTASRTNCRTACEPLVNLVLTGIRHKGMTFDRRRRRRRRAAVLFWPW